MFCVLFLLSCQLTFISINIEYCYSNTFKFKGYVNKCFASGALIKKFKSIKFVLEIETAIFDQVIITLFFNKLLLFLVA